MLARFTPIAALSLLTAFAACGGGEGVVSDEPSKPASTATTAPTTPPPPPPPSGTPDAGNGSGGTVRFVALGDQGTGTDAQIKIGNAIAAKCAKDGCDFVQLLGDNFYPSGVDSTTDDQWQTAFETPYAAIDLDFFAVLGNHDYGVNGAGTDFGKGKNEIDYTQVSSKWKMPAAYFHFANGPLEVFALDTNMILWNQADQQKTDMKAWIAASTAPWKIAVGHHPYLSNGDHGNAGTYDSQNPVPGPWKGGKVRDFTEEVLCGQVDLYLTGHDHSQQWLANAPTAACPGKTEWLVAGAGAKTTGLSADRNDAYYQSLELGFLYVTITDRKLTGEFVNESGVTEYTRVLEK